MSQQKKEYYEKKAATDSLYLSLIKNGSKYLNKKDYKKAEENFYNAYEIKPKDFNALYLYTKSLVLNCVENNHYCISAHRSLNYLVSKYPNNENIILLQDLMETKE